MTKKWTIEPGKGTDSLSIDNVQKETLSSTQIRVSMKAVSLNARDIQIANGQSPLPFKEKVTPLSDGAGIVEEIGSAVTRVKKGDRVVLTWNPSFQSGKHEWHMAQEALGSLREGVLSEEVAMEELAAVKIPENISFNQAACLPCAGTTAWNALFEVSNLRPGENVFLTGTGELSLIALQLAKAAGAFVGISSSDNSKLELAKKHGADFVVNYKEIPEWAEEVKKETEQIGAHVILENAGPPSIAQSIKAGAQNSKVVQIGWKGMDGPPISVIDMALGQINLMTVMGGSRVMLEKTVSAFSRSSYLGIPIHKTFTFDEAIAAFKEQEESRAFGKILIEI